MANIFKRTITTTDLTFLKSVFDGLGTTMVTNTEISGDYLYVTIDNTIIINFHRSSATLFNPITLTYNGTTTSEIVRTYVNGNGLRITICYSNTLFYIQLQDANSRRGIIYYEKLVGNSFYGYRGSQNSQNIDFYDIAGLSNITEIETSNIYTYSRVINLAAPVDSIFYLNSDVLFIGTQKGYENPNFRACSTVVCDQVITFEGKNYYSLGTNTLIPIDN